MYMRRTSRMRSPRMLSAPCTSESRSAWSAVLVARLIRLFDVYSTQIEQPSEKDVPTVYKMMRREWCHGFS